MKVNQRLHTQTWVTLGHVICFFQGYETKDSIYLLKIKRIN